MEELLPLIIGVVWLIYTIYNKGKKKGAKRRQPDGISEEKAPSILEQIFAGSEAFQPQTYEVYEEPEENYLVEEYIDVESGKEEKRSPFLKSELADFVQEGQSAFSSSDDIFAEEILESESHIEKQDFDLRKAIIFSEILNAPYIGYK